MQPDHAGPLRVLFLCTHNSARSQIAEALLASKAEKQAPGRFEAASAGSAPGTRVHPLALEALSAYGIEWRGQPKSIDSVRGHPWDLIITVCDRARESCPIFPGQPAFAHWGMDDPSEVVGDEETRRRAFREALTYLGRRIDLLLALPVERLERIALQNRVQHIADEVPVVRVTPATHRKAVEMDVRRWVAEAVGTFFLVLIGPGAVMVNAYSGGAVTHAGVALAFAFVITAMIYALGHLSGAHLNPAVTLGFWSVGRFPLREVAPYMVAQCLGAVLASTILRMVLGPIGQLGATLPRVSLTGAFTVEWLLSFALMFVIMAVATDERVADGFAAIAVGLTVGFCAMMGGPLTGASMNPARSFGPALLAGDWRAHWLYWIAPISGMMVGAKVYEYLRPVAAPALGGGPLGIQGPIATGQRFRE